MTSKSTYFRPVIDSLELLPELLREERLARGLSHREVAEQIPYAYADLCRFEQRKKNPTMETALRMLRWLAADAPSR